MINQKDDFLSLILPVYLQEKNIEPIARNITSVLEQMPCRYELILVVDGILADKSYIRAKTLESDNVRVVGYKHNHGKGYAVRFGMAKSRGNIIGFMDADRDINPRSLFLAYEHFRWYNADIIIASKRHPVSIVRYPWYRRIISLVYQITVRILFGLRIRDSQVGLKLFKRKVLEDIMPRLLVKKFAFDIEMLAVAYWIGYKRIFESPVELDFTGPSRIKISNFIRIVLRTLWDTLAVFYRLTILRYYDSSHIRHWKFDPELNFRVNIG